MTSNYGALRKSEDVERDRLLEEINELDAEDEKYTGFDSNNPPGWNTLFLVIMAAIRTAPWRGFLRFFIPSFLQGPEARAKLRPTRVHPTAYLDGMRGVAALFVFFCHYGYKSYTTGTGYGARGGFYHFWRLPLIRLWYQGSPGVAIFFVISGYALSFRPLKLMRSGKTLEFYQALNSTLFRRYARLFIPTAVSTFIIMMLLQLGVYEWTREFSHDRKYLHNVTEYHLRLMPFWTQVWHWVKQMWYFTEHYQWHKITTNSYDGHLWTIPVEFRCSLYLFLTILGTSQLQTKFRFGLIGLIIAHAFTQSRWEFILFLSGMVLAEIDHIRGAHVPAPALPGQASATPRQSRLWNIFWGLTSFAGLWILSQPDFDCKSTPGYMTMCSFTPEWWSEKDFRFWQPFGAVMFVAAVGRLTLWQRFFESSLIQYLGKISYALYLVHGCYIHTGGYLIEKFIYDNVTGLEGNQYNIGFTISGCIALPIVIWWADVFWRGVDAPSVKFAKWIETQVKAKAN